MVNRLQHAHTPHFNDSGSKERKGLNECLPVRLKVTAQYFLSQLIVIGASENKRPGLTWEIGLRGNKTALGGGEREQLAEDHNTDPHLARRAPGGTTTTRSSSLLHLYPVERLIGEEERTG